MIHESVPITNSDHAALYVVATSAGMSITEYLKALVAAAVPTPKRDNHKGRVDTFKVKIMRLHAANLTDAEIAQAVGMASGTVSVKRRELGLPANTKKPKGTPQWKSRSSTGTVRHTPHYPRPQLPDAA